MANLGELPLHDAVIRSVHLNWALRVLEFSLFAFVEKGKSATPHALQFSGVSNFECPHKCPWGDSVFINQASGVNNAFVIEMQSGDEIKIEATGYSFTPVAS